MKFGLLFKIVLMAVALVFVFKGIGVLRSNKFIDSAKDPNSFVNLFVGSNQTVTNWCPEKTESLELIGSAIRLDTPQDFALVCEVMIAPFEQPTGETLVYKPLIKAIGATEVVLEKAEGHPIFRVREMPFSSPGLDVHLRRILAE